jgi:hypothetical protein
MEQNKQKAPYLKYFLMWGLPILVIMFMPLLHSEFPLTFRALDTPDLTDWEAVAIIWLAGLIGYYIGKD